MGDAKTGCVWLETADGYRQAVLWPKGHRVAFNPLRIYDSDGVVVWREGVERVVGGGPSTVHAERLKPACRVDDRPDDLVWWLPLFRLPSK